MIRSESDEQRIRSEVLMELADFFEEFSQVAIKEGPSVAGVYRDVSGFCRKAGANSSWLLAKVVKSRKSLWQPMESAPRDGTMILWCADFGEHAKRRFHMSVVCYPDYKECFNYGWWQPLPPAPLTSTA